MVTSGFICYCCISWSKVCRVEHLIEPSLGTIIVRCARAVERCPVCPLVGLPSVGGVVVPGVCAWGVYGLWGGVRGFVRLPMGSEVVCMDCVWGVVSCPGLLLAQFGGAKECAWSPRGM